VAALRRLRKKKKKKRERERGGRGERERKRERERDKKERKNSVIHNALITLQIVACFQAVPKYRWKGESKKLRKVNPRPGLDAAF